MEREHVHPDMGASFCGMALPQASAPVRFAACAPAAAADPEAIAQVLKALLQPLILPFALACTLDAARAALVAKDWAAEVQNWFGGMAWLKACGLHEHFTTPAQAAAVLSIVKAVERPKREMQGALSEEYEADVKSYDFFINMNVTVWHGFKLGVGKIAGLPYTFMWRYVSE